MKPLLHLCSCLLVASVPLDTHTRELEPAAEGKPSLAAIRSRPLEDGAPLGKNLNLLSGATSDGEEAAKSKRPARRWNRLNDDNL